MTRFTSYIDFIDEIFLFGFLRLNSSVVCIPYSIQLTSSNALEIIGKYPFFTEVVKTVAHRGELLASQITVVVGFFL